MRIRLTDQQKAQIAAEQKAFRDSLPNGNVRVKWIHGTMSYQLYKGRNLICGCSGSTEEECFEHYDRLLGNPTDEEKKQYY